jgi:D-glycerate 3-kinase
VNTVVEAITRFVRHRARNARGCLVVGLCGAQGSGKSTAVAHVAIALEAQGLAVAVLSLDDLYLPRAARVALAREIHPLLATRGVPGTHDVALGVDTIAALRRGEPAALPRFDKAVDDRCPERSWPAAPCHTDILLFEGWCVGARPQDADMLARPVNALEAEEDSDGIWRRYVNDALAGSYQALFATIDALILLAAPSFEIVPAWRGQQEAALRSRLFRNAEGAAQTMDAAALARFIQHYERLTRHILATMPGYADLTLRLDENRHLLP